jgi:hypothetical protein
MTSRGYFADATLDFQRAYDFDLVGSPFLVILREGLGAMTSGEVLLRSAITPAGRPAGRETPSLDPAAATWPIRLICRVTSKRSDAR